MDTDTDTDIPIDPMADLVMNLTADEPASAAETPAVETPATETPATETPATETPATETRSTETPAAEEDDELGLDKPEKSETTAEEEVIPEAPKKRADWDVLRASRDRHKQAAEEKDQIVAELTQKVQELQAKASVLPELEEKLKDFDTYEKEIAVTRLEATREYKETILAPLEAIGGQAEILAKSNDSEADKVYEMLREGDAAAQRIAFKEITSGWDEIDRNELWNMTKDARVILDKQDAMRENASAAAKEQQALAAERETREKEQARKTFIDEAKKITVSLREKTPFVALAEGETADDRFSVLEQKLAAVDLDTQSPRGKAFAAAAALMHPSMVKTIQKLQEENATLRSRVKEGNASKPKVSPSDQTQPPVEEQDFLTSLGVAQNPMLSHSLTVVGS